MLYNTYLITSAFHLNQIEREDLVKAKHMNFSVKYWERYERRAVYSPVDPSDNQAIELSRQIRGASCCWENTRLTTKAIITYIQKTMKFESVQFHWLTQEQFNRLCGWSHRNIPLYSHQQTTDNTITWCNCTGRWRWETAPVVRWCYHILRHGKSPCNCCLEHFNSILPFISNC